MTVTNSTAKTTTFLHDDDPFEEEQEISPGIYLSKLKSNSNNSGHQNSTPSGEEARKDYEVREPSIATRIHILQLQVDKLKYSNDEIIKVMQTDDDIVLKEAVEENIALIAKKEAELAELRGKEVDTEIALDQDIDGVKARSTSSTRVSRKTMQDWNIKIGQLSSSIEKYALTAEIHKHRSTTLANRVKSIVETISKSNLNPATINDIRVKGCLSLLDVCFEEINDYFQILQQQDNALGKRVKRYGSDEETFSKWNETLQTCCEDLNLTSLEQIFDSSRDLEDFNTDVKNLNINLKNIVEKVVDLFGTPEQAIEAIQKLLNQQQSQRTQYKTQQSVKADKLFDAKAIRWEKEIGRGGFGVVWKARYKGDYVAIKKLPSSGMSNEDIHALKLEAEFMKKLSHPRIVSCLGMLEFEDNHLMVMELCVNGSLASYLAEHQAKDVEWERRTDFAVDIAIGMNYLHKLGVIHRDLKLGNVVLDEHDRAKITDFGLSVVKTASQTSIKMNESGTPQYMAPESFGLVPVFSSKSDVYAFAIVLWELSHWILAYRNVSPVEIKDSIKDGERLPINPTVPKDLGKLIISCWKANPKHRPDFADILKSLSSSSAKINKITFSTPKSIHHEKSTMPPQRFLSLRKFTKRTYILVAILFFLLIVAAVAVCVIIAANSNRRDLLDTFTASTSIISTTVAAGSLHTNPSTSNSLNSALTTASSAFTPDLGITSIPYCSTLSDVTGISPFSHVDSSTDIASTPINSGSTSAVETSTSSPVASTSDFASTPITSGSTNTDVETSTFSPVDSSTDIATTPITSGSTSAVETSTFSPVVSTSDFTSTPITSGSTNTDIEISTFSPVDSTSDIASTPITSGSTTTGVETSTSSPVDATSDIVDTLFTSTTSSEDTSNFSTLNSEIPSTDIQTDSITSSSILIESPTTTTTDPVSTTTTSVLYTTATIVSTLAGGAFDPAVLGFDGYGASVSFDKPYAIAYRRSDDMIFLSEFDAARIRTINGSGYVSTIIRNSSTIKDGPLASASFGEPFGITVNTSGNLFVSDRFGSIRVVNDTTVYTIAGNLVKDSSPDVVNPNAVTFDGAGNVYWAQEAGKIQKLSPSGTIWTLTSLFQKPRGLVFDPSTNVFYISDNHYIKNMTLDGTISIMCGSTSSGFVNDVGLNARFSGMNGLALDGKGNLIIADTNNNAVRSMNIATLNVTTIAGNRTAGMNNGFANISTFNGLRAVAVDQNGDILVSDFRSNVVRKISFVKIPI